MLRFNLAVALRYQGRLAEAIPLFEQSLESPNTMRMAGHQLAQMALNAVLIIFTRKRTTFPKDVVLSSILRSLLVK